MKDFERYSKEFYLATKNFTLKGVTTKYQLPKFEDLHTMICGYENSSFEDARLYDQSDLLDYLNYEKELWNLEKH